MSLCKRATSSKRKRRGLRARTGRPERRRRGERAKGRGEVPNESKKGELELLAGQESFHRLGSRKNHKPETRHVGM